MTLTVTNEKDDSQSKETTGTKLYKPLSNDNAQQNNENVSMEIDEQKLKLHELYKFLAENPKIIFKSQQIDDPEFSLDEKMQIAEDTFTECHLKFLRKFGRYLTKEHLFVLQDLEVFHSQDYEINYLFKNLLSDLDHHQSKIKNRRFTAMNKMMLEQNEYFSETEMMKREPLLYEQLVGQYLTQSEKNIRDGYNPKTTLFSQMLLDNYDREQRESLRKQQELMEGDMDEEDDDEESTQKSFTSSKITHTGAGNKFGEDVFPKIPPSYKKKWGDFDFDDNTNTKDEKCKPGTSSEKLTTISQFEKNQKLDSKQKYVTAGEREMLRQEFLSIMRSKFIDGYDKTFDYCSIDDNSDLDDLDQINQDCEDKYFEDNELEDDCSRNELTEATVE